MERRRRRRKKKEKITVKKISTVLYIIGSILILLGLISIIPDIVEFGFSSIFVLFLFLFIVNIQAFTLLTVGLLFVLAGSLIKEIH